MNFESLFCQLRQAGFDRWVKQLESLQTTWLVGHGDYPRWSGALSRLPSIDHPEGRFDQPAITIDGECDDTNLLRDALKGLMPWRKGPFQFADIGVDSEWRSDFKWQRLLPHLNSLKNRRILDIGCGNGYHCWRMLNEAPKTVIGIEPSVLFNMQFMAVQKYLNRPEIHILPIGIESMPSDMRWFDTVFSMGVFYHRKSPIEHLLQIKGLLAPGGELCLETLVIEGGEGEVLVPKGRYARMNNVWFIPSAEELVNWLERCGFINSRIVDISLTTVAEQRSTEWMQFESLKECLDSRNSLLTVEGLPAPKRAILLANNPG